MSKTVLIVDKDTTLMSEMQSALTERGFGVEQTTDGKGAPELIRQSRPDCVVLAVDLDAGQNGYIICKKLKSDDDLKGVPVIIIGDPKGFGQHQKLKTRAEDYVGKPLDTGALVEHVGNLVGFPPAPEPAEGESFDAAALMDEDEPATGASDLPLDSPSGEEQAEADLAMVDSMFDDGPGASDEPAPPAEASVPFDADGLMDDDDSSLRTVVGFSPAFNAGAQGAAPSKPALKAVGPSSSEDRELKARLAEASAHAEEAEIRITEFETKLRDLEAELDTTRTELEAARTSTGGKSDKDVFNLRDSVNKKDKEILRLKNELNEKENEIVELREKENSLDQQVSDSSGEIARRDAQIKTLQAKADQSGAERKKLEQQLSQAREDARTANANLSTLQSEFEGVQARVQDLETELEPLRSSSSDLETERQQLEATLSEVRGEAEAVRAQLDDRSREADEFRGQYEQAQLDLDSARNQLTSQATSFAEEIQGMRQRMSELEDEVRRAEERLRKTQQREKTHAETLEQVRDSLRTALEALAPKSSESEEIDIDELAEA